MAKGAAWMVGFKLIERSIGLLSTIVLARLLVPEDFGLIAMATSVVAVIELLQAFSFDVALIQNQEATREHYDTAWTLNVLFGSLCALILLVLSAPMAAFFGDPRVFWVLTCLSFNPLLVGLENIGVVAFRKELQMHKEFWLQLAKRLSVFVITMTAAFTLRSYWALVIGMLAGRTLSSSLTYLAHPYRPRFSLTARNSLFHFSKWLFVNNVLFVINARAADFIIGRIAGPSALGTFSLGFEISNLPTTELSAPINRATFPGYARLASTPDELRRQFLNVISMIALMTIPAAIGVAAIAENLVPVLLGEKWLSTIPLIKILAFYGVLMALQTNAGYIYMAMGLPRVITGLAATHMSLAIALTLAGTVAFGLEGTAWGLLATVALMMPINYLTLQAKLHLKASELLRILYRPIIAASAMHLIVVAWQQWFIAHHGVDLAAVATISAAGIGAISYVLAILLLWWVAGREHGPERFLIERALRLVRLMP